MAAELSDDVLEVLHQLLEKAEEGSHFAEQRLADLVAAAVIAKHKGKP